jgi:hypothetical protein
VPDFQRHAVTRRPVAPPLISVHAARPLSVLDSQGALRIQTKVASTDINVYLVFIVLLVLTISMGVYSISVMRVC